LEKIEAYLTETYQVGRMNSLLSVLKFMNRSAHSGLEEFYRLPDSQRDIFRYMKTIGEGTRRIAFGYANGFDRNGVTYEWHYTGLGK
jgi:hypothetical protein